MTQTWHITGQELWSKVDSMAHTWPSPLGHHFAWNSYTSVYSSLCTAVSKHLYPGATPASFSRGLENKLILITELKLRVGGNYFQNCQSPPAILSVTPKKLEEVKWSIHLAKWERPIWTILFTVTYQKLFVIFIPGLHFFFKNLLDIICVFTCLVLVFLVLKIWFRSQFTLDTEKMTFTQTIKWLWHWWVCSSSLSLILVVHTFCLEQLCVCLFQPQ